MLDTPWSQSISLQEMAPPETNEACGPYTVSTSCGCNVEIKNPWEAVNDFKSKLFFTRKGFFYAKHKKEKIKASEEEKASILPALSLLNREKSSQTDEASSNEHRKSHTSPPSSFTTMRSTTRCETNASSSGMAANSKKSSSHRASQTDALPTQNNSQVSNSS